MGFLIGVKELFVPNPEAAAANHTSQSRGDVVPHVHNHHLKERKARAEREQHGIFTKQRNETKVC